MDHLQNQGCRFGFNTGRDYISPPPNHTQYSHKIGIIQIYNIDIPLPSTPKFKYKLHSSIIKLHHNNQCWAGQPCCQQSGAFAQEPRNLGKSPRSLENLKAGPIQTPIRPLMEESLYSFVPQYDWWFLLRHAMQLNAQFVGFLALWSSPQFPIFLLSELICS